MEAVSFHGLSKAFGGFPVLDEAALTLEEGSRTVICGPTGCGKTTLLLILAGLVRADTGKVRLLGACASGNGTFVPPEKRRIGMVFQRSVLWPHMTARANVEFALGPLGLSRSARKVRALEALERFGAADLAGRRPETLSGGQAQRVALARSVAAAPRLLLWDEPFTGFDSEARDFVAAAARQYVESASATLVAVSHHGEDASALEAGMLFLKEGKIENAL